ncbi:hypothetical protein MB02_11880 [Croceicoccus estronivorus]|uniref:TetR/AcrR family transcriptional regulator n=1 Tax=Croceicoccus estronivorus TaxID=1172626 RepID=UPI0008358386|nr:TetR/AcrR family transcriptional regulator [Croceicoccus estronivorus]OCC23327.1 hypothetical protein MB02_11880 [Croceicoccus estronivorus]
MTEESPRRRGRRRSQEAERAILDQAMLILLQYGLQGFTLDRVAAAASVSKATIYRRWRSREEVVLAALGAIPSIKAEIKGNVIESLTGVIQQFVELVKNTPGQLEAQTRMVTMMPSLVAQCADNPALMEALHTYIEQRKAPVREILDHAISSGELLAPQNVDLLIDAIMGPIVLRLFLGGGDVSEDATRELIRLVVCGANTLK